MGCDIHTYLEYSDFDDREGNPYWSCHGGHNNLGRDYAMFQIIAGVRGEANQHIPRKGLPEGKLSWEVENDAYLTIHDEFKDQDGYCSSAQAESWANYGNVIQELPGGRKRIEHPDWHSHTWLTADELAECLGVYMLKVGETYGVPWDVTLASMRAFEERGVKTRLVIWFDD